MSSLPAPSQTAPRTAPRLATGLPTNPDVVIIGAGAAGLSAGRELQSRGISFVIVEAAGRVGGRAYTESDSFGVPVDHGCSWISGSDKNPFTRIGKDGGFTLVNHTDAETDLFDIHGNPADKDGYAAYWNAWDVVTSAIEEAGEADTDVPASTVVGETPYGAAVQSWMSGMDYGVDMDQLSTLSYWETAESQPSYIVHEGLGTIVATLADGLPIALNTPVTGIDWSGDGVAVETTTGTIRATACIVTVSTGVLAAGKIKFTPELPDYKGDSIANIPMGLLMKVPLLFDGARLGLTENNWVTYQIPEDKPGEACYFVAWPTGHDYLFGNIGGQFAWDLSAQGQDAVVDYAMGELVRLVGSDARKHFVKGMATDWAENPLTLGAYGAERPGTHGTRKALSKPLGKRVFFAGEAVAGEVSALVNGAYLSGKSVAGKVAKTVGQASSQKVKIGS